MPSKLKNIVIKEISFVTKGASGDDKHAPKILFWKGNQMPSFIDRLKGVFSKAEGDGARTPEQMLEDLKSQLSPEQQDILMLILAAAKAAPPEAAVSTPEPMAAGGDVEPEKQEEEEIPEEMQKMLDDNPQLSEHLAKIAAARKADREEIAGLKKENDARRKRERRAQFEKTVQQYTWLPGDHDKVAAMLDEVDAKLSDDSQQTLAELIRVTDGIVSKSSGRIFDEKGSSRPATDPMTGVEAVEKLETAAIAKVEAAEKDGRKLSIEKARVLVMKENRELRKAVNESRL